MKNYLDNALATEQFYRLGFEEIAIDHWSDIDKIIQVYKLDAGIYQQYVEDERGEKIGIGKPLQTIGDVINRYYSLSGFELKYNDNDEPLTAQ